MWENTDAGVYYTFGNIDRWYKQTMTFTPWNFGFTALKTSDSHPTGDAYGEILFTTSDGRDF
jgi:hypothetical protein